MLDENTGEYPTSGFSTVGMQELSHENWNGIFSSEIASLLLSHRKAIPAAAWSMVNLVWMDWHAHSNMSTPLHPFWQYGPAYNRIRRPDGSKHGWAGTLVDIWTVHSIPPSAVYNMLWCLRYLLYKKPNEIVSVFMIHEPILFTAPANLFFDSTICYTVLNCSPLLEVSTNLDSRSIY